MNTQQLLKKAIVTKDNLNQFCSLLENKVLHAVLWLGLQILHLIKIFFYISLIARIKKSCLLQTWVSMATVKYTPKCLKH